MTGMLLPLPSFTFELAYFFTLWLKTSLMGERYEEGEG